MVVEACTILGWTAAGQLERSAGMLSGLQGISLAQCWGFRSGSRNTPRPKRMNARNSSLPSPQAGCALRVNNVAHLRYSVELDISMGDL